MKFTILTAILFLLLGTTASAYARQEKGQEEHKQEARPAQTQGKPAQHQQEKPAARQQAPSNQQAQQRTQQSRQTQPQHTQQAARTQQPPTHAVNRTPQSSAGQNRARVEQTQVAVGNRGSSGHGRISDVHYASSFGSGHSFHVNRGEYDSRRFAYGGYSFGFVDPWPIGWGYSDDVYVVYDGGGYYMYDRVHPGVRISINIL